MIQRSRIPALFNNLHLSFLRRHHQGLSTAATAVVNEHHLLKISTILSKHQDAPTKLHKSLAKASFLPNHEFFIQICNKFPSSWKPVYKFHQFIQTQYGFQHNSTSFNKMLDVVVNSRNTDLLWELIHQSRKLQLVTTKTYIVALKIFASSRDFEKCVEFFHLKMNDFGYPYSLEILNKVVEALCRCKLVVEAEHLVLELNDCILPNGVTYRLLIHGFCDVGGLIEASKVWNLMVDQGYEPDVETIETMLKALFKAGTYNDSKYDTAVKLFQSVRKRGNVVLGTSTYKIVIFWLCEKGCVEDSRYLIEVMKKRSIPLDNDIYVYMINCLIRKGRLIEAYRIIESIEKPDIAVYHGIIKGFLRLKKPSEATQVFRDMISKGCEPTMHTYIMLLEGHMGNGQGPADPLVNFDTIFVGGLIKAGKSSEATKYIEGTMNRGLEVPRFDYYKFLDCYSTQEGAIMFDVVSKKLRETGQFDLADILARYGMKMATTRYRGRDRISHKGFG